MILAIIGTEGVGKSALGDKITERQRELGHKIVRLEGEVVRAMYGNSDFSDAGRIANAFTLGAVSRALSLANWNVVVTAVFPRHAVRSVFHRMSGGSVVWVHLDGEIFTDRKHGRTVFERLKPEEGGLTYQPTEGELDMRARILLGKIRRSGHSWSVKVAM
jgi:adenylylsulfate kinase-like enzyme